MTPHFADTSVVVAALSPWHEAHEVSAAAVTRHRPSLPAHVWFEAFAVMTRLPARPLPPDKVAEALALTFPETPVQLPTRSVPTLVSRLSRAGVAGGRVYDALVAATVHHAGGVLLTRDARATDVYDVVGCPHEMIG